MTVRPAQSRNGGTSTTFGELEETEQTVLRVLSVTTHRAPKTLFSNQWVAQSVVQPRHSVPPTSVDTSVDVSGKGRRCRLARQCGPTRGSFSRGSFPPAWTHTRTSSRLRGQWRLGPTSTRTAHMTDTKGPRTEGGPVGPQETRPPVRDGGHPSP